MIRNLWNNHKFKKGISIFGDNCTRFLKSKSSQHISIEKINEFIATVKHKFSPKELKKVERLLNTSEKDFWFLIKGHFLTNATINLIKTLVKKQSGGYCKITLDMIYSLTIDCTEDWSNRIDISTVVTEIRKLKSA